MWSSDFDIDIEAASAAAAMAYQNDLEQHDAVVSLRALTTDDACINVRDFQAVQVRLHAPRTLPITAHK